ncbi:MAG: hypothetical protein E7394_08490 [Ruminococcaceae bacterium]|nr:hypothetical protein [Oscillospiraceae bacterium]
MLKKIKSIIFLVCVICVFGVNAYALDVYVNGTKVGFNYETGYPYVENGRTMLPLRAVTEACGAEVWWDDVYKTACIRKNEVTVYCTLGEKNIYRNNTRIENDVATTINNGRVYLPIRSVIEALDAKIEWNGNVFITCENDDSFISGIENSYYKSSNIWSEWNRAISLQNSGNYLQAVDVLKRIAPGFIWSSDYVNRAIFYDRLGQCYTESGMYSEAAACFGREAENWALSGREQEKTAALRKSKTVQPTVQIYAKTYRDNYKMRRDFGELYEPDNGLYNGVYAECDEMVNNPSSMNKFYMNEFPKLVGREMSSYLLYMNDGVSFTHYKSHFTVAKQKDKIMQIALEPTNINNIRQNDERYINFAKEISKSGVRVFVRFACEMNDESVNWYVDPQTYKTKFQYVADIFHKYAPAAVMVWSPNFYPEDNYEAYYPGDEYVDYVGISSYMVEQPETDPLDKNVDRARWSNQLDTIYSLYGYKKPIIISECGVTYENYMTGADITDFAVKQLYDFYTYVPIKYPNVKAIYYFDSDNNTLKFKLSKNSEYLNTYKKAIDNQLYLSDPDNGKDLYQYYELGNNVNVYPENTEICSYFSTPFDNISYVVYRIGNNDVGVSYGIPYSVNIDFSAYSSKVVELKAMAFDSSGNMVAQKAYNIKVWDFTDSVPDNIFVEKEEHISAVINGDSIVFETNPVLYGDSVMVPFAEVAKSLGYRVSYDSRSHNLYAVKGEREISVCAGDNRISVNDFRISLDAAPIETDGDFLVPIEGVDVGLRCDYDWSRGNKCVFIDERTSRWSDWSEELPSDVNKNLYHIEIDKEYRFREREKEYFSLDTQIFSVNYVKAVTKAGEWSDWQKGYVAPSDTIEVRTRRVSSEPKRYYYGHYCTGDIGDKSKNYRTSDWKWCDEAKFHELGWYDYKLETTEPDSNDTILYNSNGKEKRCPSGCYRWYVINTEGGEHTEYSYRKLETEYIYYEWGPWSSWSSWSSYEPDIYYEDDIDIDVEERTYYRYKEK